MKMFAVAVCAGVLAASAAHAESAICRDSLPMSDNYYGQQLIQKLVEKCRVGDILTLGSEGPAAAPIVCDMSKPILTAGRRITCTMGKPRAVR